MDKSAFAAALSGILLAGCAAVDTPEACRLDHVADIPFRMVNGQPVVTAQVGGKPVRLVLDTGSEGIILTPQATERLGLDRDYSQAGYATGLGAQASFWPTKPVAVQLGSVTLPPRPLVVGTLLLGGGSNPAEGLLGGELMSTYDLDVDIPQRRLSLYRSRRCPGGPPPFAGPSLTVPAIPVGAYRMAVPVSLDGRTLPLLVDTGASRTTADAAAAGLSEAAMDSDQRTRMDTADPVGLSVRIHRFKTLQLGSDVVGDPVLAVGTLEKPGYSGLLGTDYWRNHRLWMSRGSGTVVVGLPNPR